MTEPGSGITIYHNPSCGTSRNVLALIRAAGIEPEIILYLQTPPDRARLVVLISAMGLTPRDILREKGTPFAELGLGDPGLSDAQLLDAMETHPILINRPIVVSPAGVALCRPSDLVLDLLPARPHARVLKEEGVPALRDVPVPGDDPGLIAALAAEGLPVDDLAEPGRRFFRYDTLDGAAMGYGGLEIHGPDALVRSVVVLPALRGTGIGHNLLALLLARAHAAGARQAWLLTSSAAAFFARAGFREVPRSAAPAAIAATRQAATLCPTSAPLMTRRIGF